LLLYRQTTSGVEVMLVHPGGPYYVNRDAGVWSVPKGEHSLAADPLVVALREFEEETGTPAAVDLDALVELGTVRQRGGKIVAAWASPADFDATAIRSNTFELEWPPKSGRMQAFPEVDRASWFDLATARAKILPAQAAFIDRLEEHLGRSARTLPFRR
jgi:predicted NUDIX family NTP pyrophosphohydrolase